MYLHDFINPENFPQRVREMPTGDAHVPQIDELDKGKWSRSSILHLTIEQMVNLLLRSQIIGYDKNRGGQPINLSKIKKWFQKNGEGVLVESLGEFLMGDFLDTKGHLRLVTHHHRSSFLLYLYWNASDAVWNAIKDEKVAVRIFEEDKFVQLYCASDDMTKQAKYGFLRNPDMVVGHIIACDPSKDGQYNGRLSPLLSIPARNFLAEKGSHLPPLATLVYAGARQTYTKNGEVKNLLESHATLYNCRQKADKLIAVPYVGNENLLQVEDDFLVEVANAIEDFLVFRSEFQMAIRQLGLTGGNTIDHQKILKYTAFFTFYIHDRVVFKMLPPAKLVSERLAYHCNGPENLSEAIRSLWNNDELLVNKRADKLTEVLRRPLPKKKVA